jgi:alpha-beta hydrolase superfamily lysophospholipase
LISAYELSPAELGARSAEFTPVERIGILAAAKVPVTLIHGDADTVVPLRENSAEVARRYREAGADSLVRLIVLPGQGHNYDEAFFHSQELVDFAIARARAGAGR